MNRKRFSLPPEQCERLNRQEFVAVKWMIAFLSTINQAEPDVQKRLECIPYGKERFRMMRGQLDAIVNDLVGTITIQQAKQLNNVIHDMTLQMVPKLSPITHNCVVNTEELAYLVKQAQLNRCLGCIKTDDECRSCDLYKILEAYAPRPDYGDGGICPYSRGDWMEDSDEEDE